MPERAIYFIDTWFWIAFIDKKSGDHAAADRISREIGDDKLVTSEMVFAELLAFFSNEGAYLRNAAVQLVEELRKQSDSVTIVPQTPDQFEHAFQRYKQYQDKEWSLTDCASMIVMDTNKITTAITKDHHFEQARFAIRNT
jgi:predicted nucleic acid-binding protein